MSPHVMDDSTVAAQLLRPRQRAGVSGGRRHKGRRGVSTDGRTAAAQLVPPSYGEPSSRGPSCWPGSMRLQQQSNSTSTGRRRSRKLSKRNLFQINRLQKDATSCSTHPEDTADRHKCFPKQILYHIEMQKRL
jgi:hypothetical protein